MNEPSETTSWPAAMVAFALTLGGAAGMVAPYLMDENPDRPAVAVAKIQTTAIVRSADAPPAWAPSANVRTVLFEPADMEPTTNFALPEFRAAAAQLPARSNHETAWRRAAVVPPASADGRVRYRLERGDQPTHFVVIGPTIGRNH